MDLIATASLNSTVSSLEFSSIPAGYKDLKITGIIYGNESNFTSLRMFINNTSAVEGSNENTEGGSRSTNTNAQTSSLFVELPQTSSVACPLGVSIDIGHAGDTGFVTASYIFSGASFIAHPSYGGRGFYFRGGRLWNFTNRVTQINFDTSNGTGIGPGTYLSLWGLKQ